MAKGFFSSIPFGTTTSGSRGKMWTLFVPLCWLALCAQARTGTIIQQSFGVVDKNDSYAFNIEIGDPPQMATVMIDFGSADLILNEGYNPCIEEACSWTGQYFAVNFSESQSLRMNNEFVNAPLASDGSVISGSWATDDIYIGDLGYYRLNKTKFLMRDRLNTLIVDSDSNSLAGRGNIFGLGPQGLQASVKWIDDNGVPGPTYKNVLNYVPDMHPSFSVWINPAEKSAGTLLLGGIDDTMYVPGTLGVVPIASPPGAYGGLTRPIYLGISWYGVKLTARDSISAWKNNYWAVGESLAILNSRVRFSLPHSILKQIGNMLSAEWASTEAMYLVRCDVQGTLTIDLGSMSLNVSLADHLVNMNADDANGTPICGLDIGEAEQIYLSHSVLKHYFLAVDYESNEIAFGTPGQGPDVAQEHQEHPLDKTIPAFSLTGPSELAYSVDPKASIFYTMSTGAVISGPKFQKSQSTQFVLGQEPLPSVVDLTNTTLNSSVFTSTTRKRNSGTRASPHCWASFTGGFVLLLLLL